MKLRQELLSVDSRRLHQHRPWQSGQGVFYPGSRPWTATYRTANRLSDTDAAYIAGTQWGTKRYLRMDLLRDLDAPETDAA